jgi:hypothetical protein
VQQLVQERAIIVKELVKLLISYRCHITTRYYMKLSHKLTASLGEDHLTVRKTYILITPYGSSAPFNNSNLGFRSTNRGFYSNKLPSSISKPTSSGTLSILTPCPLSFMFEHCFVVPHYYEALDKAYGLNSIENE